MVLLGDEWVWTLLCRLNLAPSRLASEVLPWTALNTCCRGGAPSTACKLYMASPLANNRQLPVSSLPTMRVAMDQAGRCCKGLFIWGLGMGSQEGSYSFLSVVLLSALPSSLISLS